MATPTKPMSDFMKRLIDQCHAQGYNQLILIFGVVDEEEDSLRGESYFHAQDEVLQSYFADMWRRYAPVMVKALTESGMMRVIKIGEN